MPPQEKREPEPIRDADVAERFGQMCLDRALLDVEPTRDFLVAGAFADEVRNHALARGEPVEPPIRLAPRRCLTMLDEGQQLGQKPGNDVPGRPDLAVL